MLKVKLAVRLILMIIMAFFVNDGFWEKAIAPTIYLTESLL